MIKVSEIKRKYTLLNTPFKAAIWYIGVTVIDKAVAVITQPFINRILSVEEVGTYGTFTSWHSIFNIVATFYLFCGVLEVYITKQKEESKDIVLSLCTLSLSLVVITYLIVCSFMPFAVSITGLKSRYLHIMFITIFAEAVIQFWSVPKRFEYSYKDYALLTVVVFIVKSVLSVLLAYFFVQDRVAGRLIGLCVPTVIAAIPVLYYIIRNGSCTRIRQYWKGAILFNLPLIPHYLANVLLSSSDRIMIEKLDGLKGAGLYTVAYSFSSLSLIVFSAISSAYNPFSMKAIKEKNYEKLSSTTVIMLITSMLFSVLLIYLAPEGLYVIGGEQYLEALPIIPTLVIGVFTSSFYFIFANVEFVSEKTKYIFPVTLAGAGVNIGLNYYFIPIFGYKVAALTTVVGYVIIAVSHYSISYRIVGHNIYNIKHIVTIYILFAVISLLAIPLYRAHVFIRYGVILFLLFGAVFYLHRKTSLLKSLFIKNG